MEQKIDAAGKLALSDEEVIALIRKIEAGDSPALMRLYDATSPLVFGMIARILADRASAEETLLEVYTQIWKHTGYDAAVLPFEWLMATAHRCAMDRLHWIKRDSTKHEKPPVDATPTVAPEQQVQARSLLESMAPAQRKLLEWAYYTGLSCGEMAAEIGKPIGAVKTHIRLGLSKLGESVRQAPGIGMEAGTRDREAP